jgi:hypothetical protein
LSPQGDLPGVAKSRVVRDKSLRAIKRNRETPSLRPDTQCVPFVRRDRYIRARDEFLLGADNAIKVDGVVKSACTSDIVVVRGCQTESNAGGTFQIARDSLEANLDVQIVAREGRVDCEWKARLDGLCPELLQGGTELPPPSGPTRMLV